MKHDVTKGKSKFRNLITRLFLEFGAIIRALPNNCGRLKPELITFLMF